MNARKIVFSVFATVLVIGVGGLVLFSVLNQTEDEDIDTDTEPVVVLPIVPEDDDELFDDRFEIVEDLKEIGYSFDLFDNSLFPGDDIDDVMFKRGYIGTFYVSSNIEDETNKIISNTVLHYLSKQGFYDLVTTVNYKTDLMEKNVGLGFENALITVGNNKVLVYLLLDDIDVDQFLKIDDFIAETISSLNE